MGQNDSGGGDFIKFVIAVALTPIGCGIVFVVGFVLIVGLTISQLPGWAGQGVRDWMMDIPQSTHDFHHVTDSGGSNEPIPSGGDTGGWPQIPDIPGTVKDFAKFLYFGQSYLEMLLSQTGWWSNYGGHPFDERTYLAIIFNYELASFHLDPTARQLMAEAMARRCWESIKLYGPDGCLWYLGGREMVIRRVLAGIPGINENDYDMAAAYLAAGEMLNNPDWQNGVQWNQPFEWGNPTFTADDIKKKIPAFWRALQNHNVGPGPNQILYISPDGQFFIVTQAQSVTLCKNRSCVSP